MRCREKTNQGAMAGKFQLRITILPHRARRGANFRVVSRKPEGPITITIGLTNKLCRQRRHQRSLRIPATASTLAPHSGASAALGFLGIAGLTLCRRHVEQRIQKVNTTNATSAILATMTSNSLRRKSKPE